MFLACAPIRQLHLGIQNGRNENSFCIDLKKINFGNIPSKCEVLEANSRAPDKVRIFISKTYISWLNPMFDHLLESSRRDDSNKWSNIGFGQETKELWSIEINFTHLIWSSVHKRGFPQMTSYFWKLVTLRKCFSLQCRQMKIEVNQWSNQFPHN